jgi:hypothetical protein
VLFIIVSLLLFLGIAFYQALQGTFTALIAAVLTILSAALAANFYGPLSHSLLLEHIPDYADAVSLAGIFFITLMVLRTLADHFIRSNVVVYAWPDRIAAGVLSIPTALVIVGMACISFEMLPFDDQVMMFDRFQVNQGTVTTKGIFPYADSFTAGMLEKLSKGSLESQTQFGMAHPDWPVEVSANRIGVQKESKHAVPPSSVRVEKAWRIDNPLMAKEYTLQQGRRESGMKVEVADKVQPRDGYYYLAVQMKLTDPKAADGDGYYRFGWGQVRLVGFKGTLQTRPMNIFAIGVRDLDLPAEFNYMRVKVPTPPEKSDDGEAQPGERNYGIISKSNTFDVVFEVPEDFTPWFLEFKRWGRAAVPKPTTDEESKTSTVSETSEKTEPVDADSSSLVGGTERQGWHSELQLISKGTGFTSELPFQVKKVAIERGSSEVELQGAEFVRGRIDGKIGGGAGSLDIGPGEVVAQFSVPADKRLLRLECEISPAQSAFLNQIFSSVQGVLQKKAIAKGGQAFLPVGQYLIVDEGGEQQVELIYDPDAEMNGRLEPFRSVKPNQLRGKTGRMGFLYLVPPGTEMERFEVGGTPIEAQTLRLKAPQ